MVEPYLKNLENEDDGFVVRYLKREYENFVEATQSDRVRQERNFKIYSGVDYGQWDSEAVSILTDRGQPINQFNWVQRTVDEILGALEENPQEVYYDPMDINLVDEVNLLQETYEIDYENGKFEKELHKMKRDGLIYKGVIEYKEDYSRSRFGNIGIKCINPTTVIFDPRIQEEGTEHIPLVFKWSWMTPRQIVETYKVSNEEMIKYFSYQEEHGSGIDSSNDIDKLTDRNNDLYSDPNDARFKVLEAVYMQTVDVQMLFNNKSGEFAKNITDANLIDSLMRLPGSQFSLKPKAYNICKIFTFAPGISHDLILEKREHPVQIGRIPFERWSAKNIYGQEQGVVDVIADAQITYNKREAILDYYALASATGNSFISDSAFNDDAEKERFLAQKNNPGARDFEVDGDTLAAGAISQPVPRGEYPADLDKRTDNARDFIREMGVNDALKGVSAGSRESQDSLSFKADAGLMGFETLNIGIKDVIHNLGVAYSYMFKQMYKKVPRRMKNSKKGKSIYLNQPVFNPVTGETKVLNDVEMIGQHNVMVRESPTGRRQKREKLARYEREIQTTQDPLLQSFYEEQKLNYMDLPEEAAAEAKRLAQKTRKHLELQIDAQDAQLKVQMQQMGGLQQGAAQQAGDQGKENDFVTQSANAPGMGGLPQGVGGGQTAANNQSPSDFTQ
jgi:hypothetical protein